MTLFALVDGNAFYCSCERVFDAGLARRPVVVLSNNDGCAISRTDEAKALGIGMGDPWFKIRKLCRERGVAAFSSNYALYGDMSARVNAIYRQWAPTVETYSIDESFLDLTSLPVRDVVSYVQDLRSTVRRWTGIPTCVGMGPTKTLAKLANRIAKKFGEYSGTVDLSDPDQRVRWLERMPVSDVWGVGFASVEKLRAVGIVTAGQLSRLDRSRARRLMTVTGERTVAELNGFSCMPFEIVPPTRKGLAVTRSFGSPVTTRNGLDEAVSSFATRAAEKLRLNGLETSAITVFAETSRFARGPDRSVSTTIRFPVATADTLAMVGAAAKGVDRLWAQGYVYAKAGVMLADLTPPGARQRSFLDEDDEDRSGRLMDALDGINGRYGRNTLFPASNGLSREWRTRADMMSAVRTTDLGRLPKVG